MSGLYSRTLRIRVLVAHRNVTHKLNFSIFRGSFTKFCTMGYVLYAVKKLSYEWPWKVTHCITMRMH